jgi:hypothetical protein
MDISLIVINYNPDNYIWDISLILVIGTLWSTYKKTMENHIVLWEH